MNTNKNDTLTPSRGVKKLRSPAELFSVYAFYMN